MSTDLQVVPATEPQGDIIGFDYTTLEPEVATAAKAAAERIRVNVRDMGLELSAIKEKLGHGAWGPWLKAEFGWTIKTAERRMDVAKLAAKNDKLSILPDALLNAVVAAPKDMRDDLERRVISGELTSAKDVSKVVVDARDEEARAARVAAEKARLTNMTKAAKEKRRKDQEAREEKERKETEAREAEIHKITVSLLEKIGRESAEAVLYLFKWKPGCLFETLRELDRMLKQTVEPVEPVADVEPGADLDYEEQGIDAILARQAFRNASPDLGEALTTH